MLDIQKLSIYWNCGGKFIEFTNFEELATKLDNIVVVVPMPINSFQKKAESLEEHTSFIVRDVSGNALVCFVVSTK